MNDWRPIDTAPSDIPVLTKISDARNGDRNEQPLVHHAGLWWFVDRSMYVYYSPTHWKPLPSGAWS